MNFPYKEIVIFQVHKRTFRIETLFKRLNEAFSGLADVIPIRFVNDISYEKPLYINGIEVITEDRISISKFVKQRYGLIQNFQIMPGNLDFLLLKILSNLSFKGTVWGIECDVDYTGDLKEMIRLLNFDSADLLCTWSRFSGQGWTWHKSFAIPDGWPEHDLNGVIVFLPFFRLSSRLLSGIEDFYREGGAGHHELVWPYVARAKGFSVVDIGGSGPYTKPDYRNCFYPAENRFLLSTFRYRPPMMRVGRRKETLWHPVKEWVPRAYGLGRIRLLHNGRAVISKHLKNFLGKFLGWNF